MDVIREIGLEAVQIMTLLFGILGMAFSMLLLFSPNVAKNLSSLFNRNIDTSKHLNFLDRDIRTDLVIYNHPILVGFCLVAGSLFGLIFFFFKLDVSNFSKILFGPNGSWLIGEIVFEGFAWVGKIACLLGLLAGICLLFAPTKMQGIERKLNAWFETDSAIAKLDRSSHELDTVLYRHPIMFGLIGGLISFLLIVLSTLNILD
jgi:hypothetical protein